MRRRHLWCAVVAAAGCVVVAACSTSGPDGYPAPADIAGPEVDAVVELSRLSDLGRCPPGEGLTDLLAGSDGAQVEYRADASSVLIGLRDVGDGDVAAELLDAVRSSSELCDDRYFRTEALPDLEQSVAASSDVSPEDVFVQRGTRLGGAVEAPIPSEVYERAVVSLGDGRIVVVTTVSPPDEELYDLTQVVAASVESARGVEGVPDRDSVRAAVSR